MFEFLVQNNNSKKTKIIDYCFNLNYILINKSHFVGKIYDSCTNTKGMHFDSWNASAIVYGIIYCLKIVYGIIY